MRSLTAALERLTMLLLDESTAAGNG
jgi:hypothetical protein